MAREHEPARGDRDAVGDAEAAAGLYEQLVPYGDRVALSYPEISTGSVSRGLGLLATVMGATTTPNVISRTRSR